MIEKRCSSCREMLPISRFHKHKSRPDGYSEQCKECRRISRQKKYSKTKDKQIENALQWRKNNPEKYITIQKRGQKKWLKSAIDNLSDFYIKQKLRKTGIDLSKITPELIELKRILMQFKRIIKAKKNHK